MSLSQLTQPICQLSSDDSKNLQILSIDMVALLEILGGLSEIFLQDETFQERREVCRSFVEK